MDDDDVIDLNNERVKRDYRAGERAHESGDAFAFSPYDFNGDGIGFIDGVRPVIVMLDGLRGVCMTVEDARLLGEALLDAVKSPYLNGDGSGQ